jgi:pantetheine-phosphate adenylyltransferase
MDIKNKNAIYPGTFDPITFGHLDILLRAAKIFDHIVLAIAKSTTKISIFKAEERQDIAQNEINALGIPNISIMIFDGLLVEFANKQGIKTIVRGLRALSDFEYEFQMAYVNRKLSKDLETIFLPATEKGHFISSTFVKEVARLGGNLNGLVSDNVAKKLIEHYKLANQSKS